MVNLSVCALGVTDLKKGCSLSGMATDPSTDNRRLALTWVGTGGRRILRERVCHLGCSGADLTASSAPQNGKTPLQLAKTEDVKKVFHDVGARE